MDESMQLRAGAACKPTGTVWTVQSRGNSESQLDFESAFLLRCALFDVFENAKSWRELLEKLNLKGFRLAFEGERLALVNIETGASVATCRFLGFSFATLAKGLGKPCVLANTGDLLAL